MRTSVGLLLRGIRWRLGASALTVITAAIAVGAAVLGPLYLRTAGDSAVRSTVTSAAIEDRGATLSALPTSFGFDAQGISPSQILRSEQIVERIGGLHRWYGQPITTILSGVGLAGPAGTPLRSQLLSRTGICEILRFRSGRCQLGPEEVAVSDRSARELGVGVGSRVDATVAGSSRPLRLRVTGIYATPNTNAPYWWGNGAGYFAFGKATSGQQHIPEIDSLIASPATALAVPVQEVPQISGDVPLRAGQVSISDENAVRRGIANAQAAVAGHSILMSTQLPSLLASADHQRHVMATIVVVAAIELVVLALWVLGSLLVRTSEARRSEIRVARLRGFPGTTMLWATAAEPALLCLVGLVVGVGAAWGAVLIARNRLLDPAASISPDLWAFAALALTVVAIIGALSLGTVRLLRTSALGQSASAARPATTRLSLVGDVILLVLAAVALVALGTSGALSGRSNPIASAAPGLIALGAAVLAVQLVLFVCRLGVSASAFSTRVAPFLGLRQVVRRPAVLRHARVLIIALGLACFATSAWAVARSNRADVATFNVGAREVVTVTPVGAGLEQGVERADPRGRFAMAAVQVTTPSSTLLAVDTRRFPAIAYWPAGISRSSLGAIGRALRPQSEPSVMLPDAPVRVTASIAGRHVPVSALANLDLAIWVFNPRVGTTIVSLGTLRTGEHAYRAPIADSCPQGCRLVGLGAIPAPNRHAPTSGVIDLHVHAFATRTASGSWRALGADLTPHGWQSTVGTVRVSSPAPGALTLAIPASAAAADVGAVGTATPPMAAVADVPSAVPVLATTEVDVLNGASPANGTIPTQGLDGNTLDVKPVATASALPRVGGDATMVDLSLLGRLQSAPTIVDATDQVWLGPAAPADALARLQAAGLRVDGTQTASAVLQQAQRSGPALADDFLLVATIVALLAAAASTLGTLGTTARQRATELAAFEVSGVSRRALAGSLAVEAGVLAVTTVTGTAAGILAAAMAVPSLPELAGAAPIPLQYHLPAGLLAAVSGAVLIAVLVSCAAVGAVLVTRTSPSLLRTAPDDTAA